MIPHLHIIRMDVLTSMKCMEWESQIGDLHGFSVPNNRGTVQSWPNNMGILSRQGQTGGDGAIQSIQSQVLVLVLDQSQTTWGDCPDNVKQYGMGQFSLGLTREAQSGQSPNKRDNPTNSSQ